MGGGGGGGGGASPPPSIRPVGELEKLKCGDFSKMRVT